MTEFIIVILSILGWSRCS